jgi:hypothetical protein
MHIKIFMASGNSVQERDLLKDFATGIESWVIDHSTPVMLFKNVTRIGRWTTADISKNEHHLSYEYAETYKECDVAVFFGSWKPREKGSHQTRLSIASNAKRFVCIETPLLNRVTDQENQQWRVGVNGFLNLDASWPVLNRNAADQKLNDLGIQWSGWRSNPEGHILVALQLPGDASLRGIDINDWAYRTILDIRKNSNRFIVVRNHPMASQRAFGDHEELARKLLLAGVQNIKFSDGQVVPWYHDLDDAYCTVTYTSGLAIDSVVSGIPTVACDPGNFAWGISSNSVTDINNVKMESTEVLHAWLRNLAGCQWSVEEMQNGTAWQHLLPVIERIQ